MKENNKMGKFENWVRKVNNVLKKEIGKNYKDLDETDRDSMASLYREGLTPEEAVESLFFSASNLEDY